MCVRSLALVRNLHHVPLLSRLSKVGHATQFLQIQPTIGKISCASPSFWYLMITWIFLLKMFWAILEQTELQHLYHIVGHSKSELCKENEKKCFTKGFHTGSITILLWTE